MIATPRAGWCGRQSRSDVLFFGLYLEHLLRGTALGRSRGVGDLTCHRQPVPVLHGDMAHIAEVGLASGGLAVKPADRIGDARVRVVLAFLAVEVRTTVLVA